MHLCLEVPIHLYSTSWISHHFISCPTAHVLRFILLLIAPELQSYVFPTGPWECKLKPIYFAMKPSNCFAKERNRLSNVSFMGDVIPLTVFCYCYKIHPDLGGTFCLGLCQKLTHLPRSTLFGKKRSNFAKAYIKCSQKERRYFILVLILHFDFKWKNLWPQSKILHFAAISSIWPEISKYKFYNHIINSDSCPTTSNMLILRLFHNLSFLFSHKWDGNKNTFWKACGRTRAQKCNTKETEYVVI